MAFPSTVITRWELGVTFSEFNLAANRLGFIGPSVFRPFFVKIQAANITKIPLKSLLENRDTRRAPGATYMRSDFEFDKFDYKTEEQGAEEVLDDRTLAIYRDILDAESVHSERAIDVVLRNYEKAAAAAAFNTAVWTGAALTTAVTNKWSNQSTATPIEDVDAARKKILDGSGLLPNALILPWNVYRAVKNCDEITDRLHYWGGQSDLPRVVTAPILAALFDLDFVLVPGGIQNTAGRGQTASLSQIWSDSYAMLCRVAVTDDPQEPCIGRTFMWADDNAGAVGSGEELAVIVEEYREENRRGGVIRARNDRAIEVMYPEAGHLLSIVY